MEYKSFSERYGFESSRKTLQLKTMDTFLNNSIWNVIRVDIWERGFPVHYRSDFVNSDSYQFAFLCWTNFFVEIADYLSTDHNTLIHELRRKFASLPFNKVYDFIEFILLEAREFIDVDLVTEKFNSALKKYGSGYTILQNLIVPITDERELKEIDKAIKDSIEFGLKGVTIHLTKSLALLSDRENPDYRNSIKESISAVESICKVIVNEPNADLAKALKKLSETVKIHSALKDSMIKLYRFAGDEGGVRHAMMDESNLDKEDAIYFLVSCSAFINYLLVKASKAGIDLK